MEAEVVTEAETEEGEEGKEKLIGEGLTDYL